MAVMLFLFGYNCVHASTRTHARVHAHTSVLLCIGTCELVCEGGKVLLTFFLFFFKKTFYEEKDVVIFEAGTVTSTQLVSWTFMDPSSVALQMDVGSTFYFNGLSLPATIVKMEHSKRHHV